MEYVTGLKDKCATAPEGLDGVDAENPQLCRVLKSVRQDVRLVPDWPRRFGLAIDLGCRRVGHSTQHGRIG
jgi:hypothetical protein